MSGDLPIFSGISALIFKDFRQIKTSRVRLHPCTRASCTTALVIRRITLKNMLTSLPPSEMPPREREHPTAFELERDRPLTFRGAHA